jgi:hypothetical protein
MALVAKNTRLEQLLLDGPTPLATYDGESFSWFSSRLIRRTVDWNTLVALAKWDPRIAEHIRFACGQIDELLVAPSLDVRRALTALLRLADVFDNVARVVELSAVWRTSWAPDSLSVGDALAPGDDAHVVDTRTLQEWQLWLRRLASYAKDSYSQAMALLNRYKAAESEASAAVKRAAEPSAHADNRQRTE